MSAHNAGGGNSSGDAATDAAPRVTGLLKRPRCEDDGEEAPDSIGASGGSHGGAGVPVATALRLSPLRLTDSTGPQPEKRHAPTHDPAPFECPCDAAEYDCQKRAPVRSACACNRLLCRKCAGVLACLPSPCASGCDLCGAPDQGPFEVADFPRDVGVLATLMMTKLHSPATASRCVT